MSDLKKKVTDSKSSTGPNSNNQNRANLPQSIRAAQHSPSYHLTSSTIPQHALNTQTSLRIPTSPTTFANSPATSFASSGTGRNQKRKMDLNSQLQAAVSYDAVADLSDSLLLNNHLNHNHISENGPPIKKTRTNTPWTPEEEKRLKELRDVGTSWSEIAKSFPNRTEGSVKKHWYKDMHYAEFSEDEKNALFDAIRDYDTNKWKFIGNKVGKPAKACEQFAREHFNGK